MADLAAEENARIAGQYTKEARIGEGTYAVVFRGRQLSTGRQVAIKKIKVGVFKDGLDLSAVREVKALREIKHPNVIELLDVFSTGRNLNLVLEFLVTDLEAVIKDKSLVFKSADVKSWMAMILRGLEFCHRHWVLHRDLKPNNFLIASNGELKIADFGLARDLADPDVRMSNQVVTRWYRPPELFFGARSYSTAVDMWSVGTIFAEIMLRMPFLAGENDFQQLDKIFQVLGSPTEEDWPGHTKLPDFVPSAKKPRIPFHTIFTGAGNDALDLLDQMLRYNPRKRVSAAQALRHPYFSNSPPPTAPSKLPKPAAELKPRPLPPPSPRTDSGRLRQRLKTAATAVQRGPLSPLNVADGAEGGNRRRGVRRAKEEDGEEEADERPAKKVARRLEFGR